MPTKSFFAAEFINKGDLIFDIGANIGLETAKFLNYGAKVISVEPQQFCYSQLRSKFLSEKNVIILQKGVADKPGRKKLYICDKFNEISTFSSDFMTKGRHSKNFIWNRIEEVEVTTLDKLIDEFGLPKFCKIDVEGYEYNVIIGLSHKIPYLSFEFHIELISETKKIIAELQLRGYNSYNLTEGFKETPVFKKWVKAENIFKYISKQNEIWPVWGNIYTSVKG